LDASIHEREYSLSGRTCQDNNSREVDFLREKRAREKRDSSHKRRAMGRVHRTGEANGLWRTYALPIAVADGPALTGWANLCRGLRRWTRTKRKGKPRRKAAGLPPASGGQARTRPALHGRTPRGRVFRVPTHAREPKSRGKEKPKSTVPSPLRASRSECATRVTAAWQAGGGLLESNRPPEVAPFVVFIQTRRSRMTDETRAVRTVEPENTETAC